ncbi:DUF427 domain-containing protein [Streptomyces lavendulae]|uniref:DUF427 domain-containing protein n=1 Tax=Streptomyces lavendulae TaxID=1914 RepID=UPI003681EFE5
MAPAREEEAGRRVESVWDYPRPPRCERDSRRVTVRHEGVTLADSTGCFRVLETSHPPVFYIPRDDVRTDLLRRSPRTTWCEWKGAASFWDLATPHGVRTEVAWSYEEPSAAFAAIRGCLAFYASDDVRCSVAGDPVRPQPGEFYGGWITSEISGPFKGAPGTAGW